MGFPGWLRQSGSSRITIWGGDDGEKENDRKAPVPDAARSTQGEEGEICGRDGYQGNREGATSVHRGIPEPEGQQGHPGSQDRTHGKGFR